jgi:outer membrane protein OmpA-like peptidoglycan-associated protein
MNSGARSFRFLLVLILAMPFAINAKSTQSSVDKKKLKKAENFYNYSEYEEALPIYLDVVKNTPNDWLINYRIGICYYYSTTARPRSVSYLDKASAASSKDTVPDLLYHAGLAHLCVNEFDIAEKYFLSFKRKAGSNYRDEKLNQLIKGCATGREMWKNPGKARITNLGSNVNSAYPDYAPVVIYRSDILLFTSKRPGNTGNEKDDEGFYYEDIYQAKGESWNRWKEPARYDTSAVKRRGIFSLLFNKAEVVSQLNTEDHDGSITLSPDSNDLYIFRYGDIMKAKWDGKRWQRPARIGEEIDARASHEPSIFLSRDGKSMFFVSDRKGGVGQKDIWICDKEGSDWGKPHNLGMNVNSPFNEDSPFLTPDGNTLYFSSEGHNSMGGYDVFSCTRQPNGTWSAPVNLGAPINNGGDDIFYTPLENGSGAYYSSLNRDGEGDLDLFFIQYFPPVDPLAKFRLSSSGLSPLDRVTVKMSYPDGKEIRTFELAGNDSVMFPYEAGSKIVYEISAPGITTVTTTLDYAATDDQFVLQDIDLNRGLQSATVDLHNYYFNIDDAINPADVADPFTELPVMRTHYLDSLASASTLSVHYSTNSATATSIAVGASPLFSSTGEAFSTLYFDFDNAAVNAKADRDLQSVIAWMKANPNEKIEIIGHADEKGDAVYNQRLSEKRASAVEAELIKAGLSPDRIITTGKGENDPVPVGQNTDPNDPGKENRRVIIRIAQ